MDKLGLYQHKHAPTRPPGWGPWRAVNDALVPRPAPDGRTYVSTTQAAAIAGVAVCTVSSWRARGLLHPAPWSPLRKPMYDLQDVLATEKHERDAAVQAGHGYWAQRATTGLRRPHTHETGTDFGIPA